MPRPGRRQSSKQTIEALPKDSVPDDSTATAGSGPRKGRKRKAPAVSVRGRRTRSEGAAPITAGEKPGAVQDDVVVPPAKDVVLRDMAPTIAPFQFRVRHVLPNARNICGRVVKPGQVAVVVEEVSDVAKPGTGDTEVQTRSKKRAKLRHVEEEEPLPEAERAKSGRVAIVFLK